jgi:OmpA-OmpF porin, OOP family
LEKNLMKLTVKSLLLLSVFVVPTFAAAQTSPSFRAEEAAAFLRSNPAPTSGQPATNQPEASTSDTAPEVAAAAEAGECWVVEGSDECVQPTAEQRAMQLGNGSMRRATAAPVAGRTTASTRPATRAVAPAPAKTVASTARMVLRDPPRAKASVAAPTPRRASTGRPSVAPPPRGVAALANGNLMITFRTGSAVLMPQARANAQEFAKALNMPDLRSVRLSIEGHTDAVGDAAENRALSERRAQAVRNYLVQLGVSASRLVAVGYGEDRLAYPDFPSAPQNRRVQATKVN